MKKRYMALSALVLVLAQTQISAIESAAVATPENISQSPADHGSSKRVSGLSVAEVSSDPVILKVIFAENGCYQFENLQVYCLRTSSVDNLGVLQGKQIVQFAGGNRGDRFSCAVTTDGTIGCRGDNFYGQLGDNTTRSSKYPVSPVLFGDTQGLRFKRVATDGLKTCAVSTTSRLVCWGNNQNAGGLLTGSTDRLITPRIVNDPSLANEEITSISSSYEDGEFCALSSARKLYCSIDKPWFKFGSFSKIREGYWHERHQISLSPVDAGGAVVQLSQEDGPLCVVLQTGVARCIGKSLERRTGLGESGYRLVTVNPASWTDAPVVNVHSESGLVSTLSSDGLVFVQAEDENFYPRDLEDPQIDSRFDRGFNLNPSTWVESDGVLVSQRSCTGGICFKRLEVGAYSEDITSKETYRYQIAKPKITFSYKSPNGPFKSMKTIQLRRGKTVYQRSEIVTSIGTAVRVDAISLK